VVNAAALAASEGEVRLCRAVAADRQACAFAGVAVTVVTRKQAEQVNSSACFGATRTESSSPDRSAPGSSKPSAVSVSSTSMTPPLSALPAAPPS